MNCIWVNLKTSYRPAFVQFYISLYQLKCHLHSWKIILSSVLRGRDFANERLLFCQNIKIKQNYQKYCDLAPLNTTSVEMSVWAKRTN